ncbi:hypothetical protein BHQ15_02950 [Mycolicibacillus koreensis]|nr:hypothetical protein BHQ15_02950 [Mycolicibacillus koreensis]
MTASQAPAAPTAEAPPLFSFTDEHHALREVLGDVFTAGGATPWSRLFSEVGAGEILSGIDGTPIDMAILAEQAGAALYPGPVLSTVALGTLIEHPELAAVADGTATVAVTSSLAGFAECTLTATGAGPRVQVNGHAEPVWELTENTRVLTDVRLDGHPGIVALDPAAAPRALEGIDLSRRFGALHAEQAPATVLCAGPDATAALRTAHRRVDLAVAAELLGLAQHGLDATVAYVGQRIQFGRTIGSFQAVKHRLADLLAAVELTRSAVYGAAWGLTIDPDARQSELDLAVAAATARRTAADVAVATVQLHGGIAITWEHWAHHYLRRTQSLLALTGTAAQHRERIAALMSTGSGDDR